MHPSAITTTLGGCFVVTIKEHCGYLLHYDANNKDLRDRIQTLRAMRDTLLLHIEEDKGNGKVIAPGVDNWLGDAETILHKEDEAPKKCLQIEGWGPDYYLSRKAKKKSLKIKELLEEAAKFPTKTSYSRSLTGIGSSSSEGIKHFESRTKMADKVLEALADDEVNLVLICGMGGIGKSTMAQEVAKRAIDGKLFNEFVTAVVSRTPNWTKIQDQIAGLNFDNEVGRAKKLSSRRRNSGRVLVILDDVWQALNLGDIGIPYGGEVNRCKILLTSRSEEVLINKKKVLKIFKIDDLSEEEAWNLFSEVAGDCVDTPDINSIAKEVVKECGRLPQAIVTVGAALQNKSTVEWRVALRQLQNSTPECIHGLDPTVYSSIEFSYSNLQDEAVKSCFLLCCLFPEDSDIPIEYIVRYGVGKGLFEMIDNVAVARDRVHAIIKNLQRSSLLLDSKKEECVKMHDVIRDVAISIAKKEKGFLVRCTDKIEEWPEQDTYEHSAISLVSQELKKHPDGLECPKLELLQLACGKNCTKTQTFPSNMFKEMNKLKVLSMEGMSFPSLPQSILVLQNLRTLLLDYCKIEDVSEIGALEKLEILSFLGSNITELPREIGNLSHLKLFDLSNCSALQKIPAGLLSRLNYLEELYMFGVNKEGAIASLTELKSLSKRFSGLKIHIPNIKVLPKDLLFKNPELKFQIFAGEEGIYQELSGTGSYLFENSLALERSDASDIVESPVLLQLLKKSKILYLKQIKGLKNILYGLDQDGFQCLKILRVFACKDVEYVINATSHQTSLAAFPILESLEFSDLCNLKEIFHSQFPERSFSNSELACFGNLRSLLLSRCSRLENVFSSHMIESLRNLESIKLWWCDSLEVIFQLEELNAEESHVASVLDQLRELHLSYLPKLKHIWMKGPERITGFGNLRFLAVWACNSLTYLLSPSIAKLLVMLEDIKVIDCEKIEEILERAREEEEEKKISFYKVKSIWLKGLPNLKWFCNEVNAFEWPSLKKITVIRCPALCTFVPSDLNTPKLEEVYGPNEWDQQTMFPLKGDLNATIQHMFKGKEKQVDQETRLQGKNMSSLEGDEDLITEKIKENLLERIRQQIGHPSHLNSNIKNLKDQFEKLRYKRVGVQLEIEAAERNGEIIAPVVIRWVEKVDNISRDLQRFLDEDVKANKMCLDGWCPNPKTRYSLSRKAKKKTLEIDGLLSDAAQFVTRVFYSSIEGIMDFGSRTKMRREVLEALRAEKVNMIAICGMGGIGKTTMAKEVAKRAKDYKLFDEVVMVVVSQNQDLRKIQVHIAEMLGLQLVEENPLVRAKRLNNRLSMDSKSVLVILDDVWDAIDLEAIGIPYRSQHNSCKILLTSRSEEACTKMKTQKIFPIDVLPEEEAWNLFREMAGNCIETLSLSQIAKEVARECGGLPVAIVTVGSALENKSEFEWCAALQQLKNSIPKNIPGLVSKVYSSIELSYRYLESDKAKSCFLLCCLFPKDYDILIEDLVRYGGQWLFAKIDTVAEARNRVHAMVKNLKRSYLLLDSEEGEEHVKMQGVVRDVAISIAENKGFLVRCNEKMEEWPERDSCERSTAISLVSKELKRHPNGLECPKLELLQLSCDKDTLQMLTPNLFAGMNDLKVLSLINMSFPSLPQSINVLQNLRTLQFVSCEITDVSAIGELRKLEILSFRGSEIKELPGEMRNLSCLKLLELTACSDLERIPPDLLSSLSNLEELYMFGVDVMWKPMEEEEVDEEEEEEKKGANASLTELMSLSNLVALKIQIPNIKVLPKDLPFKNETIKFQIRASGNGDADSNYLFKNSLGLANCDLSDIAERQMLLQLLKRSEILRLEKIKDLKNIAYELDKEGFQCLKFLQVVGSEDVEYVMDATSYLTPPAAFPILESLVLVGLTNLKEIYHRQFPDRSSSSACFGSLKSLRLRTLPRLIGFCTGVGPVELVQPSLNQEVGRIGTDEVTNLEKHKTTDIQQHTGPFPESTPIISHKLFSSNTILWAPNLENLELEEADSLEVVFDLEGLKVNEDHQRIAVLAQLKTLDLKGLSELTYVWKNVLLGIQGFQKLTSIKVSECHRLRYLFPTSIAKLLVELQSIQIVECDAIENIVQKDGEEEATDIKAYSFEWSSIKEICLEDCPKLKTIGSEIQSPRKSKKINRELDSRPNEQELGSPSFLCRCLECVPRRKNYSLMAVSDQGTTNKSQSYSVKEEGTLIKPKDPKVGDIDNPSEIRSLFPSHMIEWLKNLESITLVDCDLSHEVIFQLEELNVGESHVASVLDLLRELNLRGLNNLMHIWKKGLERILGFGNMRYLKVEKCNSLTYLFLPSIAKLLVMLEDITVIRCGKIEEILARAGEEEEEKDVLFHKVNSIVLSGLPKLKCFCNEANALEWPSLKKISVKECPSLSTFIPSNLKTPMLEVVDDNPPWGESGTNHWKGELNATIEHIFKGKEKQANHETKRGEQIETIEKDMWS